MWNEKQQPKQKKETITIVKRRRNKCKERNSNKRDEEKQ
jgi:hypothetical protein